MDGSGQHDRLWRIWSEWALLFVHDVGTLLTMARGYAKLLAREVTDERWTRMLHEQETALAKLAAYLRTTGTAAYGSRKTLREIVNAIESVPYGIPVEREGDLEIPCPCDELLFCLWLVVVAQGRGNHDARLRVAVTDKVVAIRIGPDAELTESWSGRASDGERWWLADIVDELLACGHEVDLHKGRDAWCLVIRWSRTER